jgi:integrase/recombinase XerD
MSSTKIQRRDKSLQIYNYDKEIQTVFNQAEREMSSTNFQLMQKYDQEMIRQSLAKATRKKALRQIQTLTKMIDKDWNKMTRDDVDTLIYHVMQRYADEKGQETHMSYDSKKHIKIFLRWVITGSREKHEDGDPKELRGIKSRNVKDRLSREDLITPEDLELLLKACSGDLMEKAMIHLHYEAGTRPGELLNMQIKHVSFDDFGAKIKVDGKTNARPIRLVESSPDLSAWINVHPFADDLEAPLWILRTPAKFGQAQNYFTAKKMLKRIVDKSGLKKRIHFNLFRHSEATRMAKYLTEAELKKRQGWTNSSRMPARYVHMVDSDVEDKVLGMYGLKNTSEDNEIQKVIPCPTCSFVNSPESKMCSRCAKPMSVEVALEREESHKTDMERMMREILRQQQSIPS